MSIDYVEFSEKALSICRVNYEKNCGRCPLRPVCCSYVGEGRDKLNRWAGKVNELAEEVAV